jgi:hypothetical protein
MRIVTHTVDGFVHDKAAKVFTISTPVRDHQAV